MINARFHMCASITASFLCVNTTNSIYVMIYIQYSEFRCVYLQPTVSGRFSGESLRLASKKLYWYVAQCRRSRMLRLTTPPFPPITDMDGINTKHQW